ncbi:MAG: hypothetical protein ABI834_07625 [Ginsengibacter sp.]
MRNDFLFLLLFIAILPVACTMPEEHKDEKIVEAKMPARKDPFHELCQYWEVTDAENPTFRDVYDQHTEGIRNFPGIIFMTDSTFLENPKSNMHYGTFILKGKVIIAQFDGNKKAVYTIQNKQGDSMRVTRVEDNHPTTLYLKGSQIFWPEATLNPFNKNNSKWRVRPSKAESPAELNERLKNCVQFYEYFLHGYSESENDEIDFAGYPTCFKWYQGAIYVLSPKHLDKKWINCFYSEEQAMQARQMIENIVTTKKYNWDTTQKNWPQQTADVLKQIHDKM